MTELVAIGVVGLLVVARATTSWLLGKHVQAVAIEAPPQPRPSSPYREAAAVEAEPLALPTADEVGEACAAPDITETLEWIRQQAAPARDDHKRGACPDWCPYCARAGARRQACKRCDGSGSDPVFERRPTCLRCDGAGKDPGGHYNGSQVP